MSKRNAHALAARQRKAGPHQGRMRPQLTHDQERSEMLEAALDACEDLEEEQDNED